MIRILKIFIGITIISASIFAQEIPNSFNLQSKSLQKVNSDPTPSGNAVEYIEFMGDDVWIASTVGVSKSTDGGETWTNYSFGNDGISALGINRDTVWVATWYAEFEDGETIAFGTGLHYSADKGDNWIDIPQSLDPSDDSSVVYGVNSIRTLPVTVIRQNFSRDIAFTKGTVWVTNFAGGLRKTTDLGETWERVVLPPDYLDYIHPDSVYSFSLSPTKGTLGFEENFNHRLFSVRTYGDSLILAGSAGGINMSLDGGISWRKFTHQNQKNGISGNFILDINYDESRNTIWAATWKANDENEFYGLSSSSDMGENWNTYLAGENIYDIAFTYDSEGNEEDVYVATYNGAFRTSDLGDTWLLAPEMIDVITDLPITTDNFRAVNTIVDSDGYNNLWFGTDAGTAKFIETGDLWEGSWSVLVASPDINESIAFPNPFSPDEERIKIKYRFDGSSKSVSIRIFDFGMNLVRTVMQNITRVGGNEYIDTWDGRDENNQIVPNGVYFYRIDMDEDEPFYGKIMVLM